MGCALTTLVTMRDDAALLVFNPLEDVRLVHRDPFPDGLVGEIIPRGMPDTHALVVLTGFNVARVVGVSLDKAGVVSRSVDRDVENRVSRGAGRGIERGFSGVLGFVNLHFVVFTVDVAPLPDEAAVSILDRFLSASGFVQLRDALRLFFGLNLALSLHLTVGIVIRVYIHGVLEVEFLAIGAEWIRRKTVALVKKRRVHGSNIDPMSIGRHE